MELMLDTNVCIYLIKERPPSVVERFATHAVCDIGISVMTLAELEYGVSKSGRPARNREALDQFISPLEVAPFDRQATAAYGKLRTTLEKKGQTIGSMDLLNRGPRAEPGRSAHYAQHQRVRERSWPACRRLGLIN